MLTAGLLATEPWQWARREPAVATSVLAALLLAAIALVLLRRPAAGFDRDPWLLTDRGIASAVGATMALGLTALLWMLQVAGRAPTAAQRSTLNIEAIKYGIGSVAAAGGLAALLLAVRRQRLAERTQRYTEQDSHERRVTDLYSKAVELLGSSDAAVRLGGLYALDRLAQDNPEQRQPIVNVVCALLRMPFAPPDDGGDDEAAAPADRRDPHEHLQVRITAQGILTRHLCTTPGVDEPDLVASPTNPFWPGIDLDLTGARLIDWSFDRGRLRRATFSRTEFSGRTGFADAVVADAADFDSAVFKAPTEFDKSLFEGSARFVGARFHREVSFNAALFAGSSDFGSAAFADDADFDSAVFRGAAGFESTQFIARALFRAATFGGVARFRQTVFHRRANFSEVPFRQAAVFSDAQFRGDAEFVTSEFGGDAWFAGTSFASVPDLTGARRTDREHNIAWPAGWREDPVSGELVALSPPDQLVS
jgi:uncharacterized protein YjbI with pentapeptide repeats